MPFFKCKTGQQRDWNKKCKSFTGTPLWFGKSANHSKVLRSRSRVMLAVPFIIIVFNCCLLTLTSAENMQSNWRSQQCWIWHFIYLKIMPIAIVWFAHSVRSRSSSWSFLSLQLQFSLKKRVALVKNEIIDLDRISTSRLLADDQHKETEVINSHHIYGNATEQAQKNHQPAANKRQHEHRVKRQEDIKLPQNCGLLNCCLLLIINRLNLVVLVVLTFATLLLHLVCCCCCTFAPTGSWLGGINISTLCWFWLWFRMNYRMCCKL